MLYFVLIIQFPFFHPFNQRSVNNAGIGGHIGFFFDKQRRSVDEARVMMDINVLGPARVIQAVLPAMKKQKSGRIINTTSGTGIEGNAKFQTIQ